MYDVDEWAEIRRLHFSERSGIKTIARRLGVARNTVRAAVPSERPRAYERERRGSAVDAVEEEIRRLLRDAPDMAASVVVFENDRVRVLEYRDEPGQRTSPHEHPDSVMLTLSSFDRRLVDERGESRDVTLERGLVRWLDAQVHSGENIGRTPTHVLFVELKEPTERRGAAQLGPT